MHCIPGTLGPDPQPGENGSRSLTKGPSSDAAAVISCLDLRVLSHEVVILVKLGRKSSRDPLPGPRKAPFEAKLSPPSAGENLM